MARPEVREPDWSKVDPNLRAAFESDEQVNVLVLARKQLLDTPGGFERFTHKHQGESRSTLRQRVMRQLRQLAATDQERLRKALAFADTDVESYWLINAFSAPMTLKQVATASHLEGVRYLFPAGPLAAVRQGPSRVSKLVAAPQERKDFDVENKEVGWNLSAIHADWAWKEHGATGEGVLVAVYDAGVNYIHEDLRDNLWRNPGEVPNDGVDDDDNGLVDDVYGWDFDGNSPELLAGKQQHGTFTTGLVVGDGSGGQVTGVAPRARFLMLRAWGGLHRAVLAHEYALEKEADIMNMSFSSANLGQARGVWRLMSEQATCAGLVLVSGAGNFQQSQPIPVQLRIPEGIPCVIAAGGVRRDLTVPPFVSLGPVEWQSVEMYGDHPMPRGLTKPDVCGFPGPNLPLLGRSETGYLPARNRLRGNSFSGPHVAGVAALVLSIHPELTAWRVKEILEASGSDIAPTGKDSRTGTGLVDAYRAVKLALAERRSGK